GGGRREGGGGAPGGANDGTGAGQVPGSAGGGNDRPRGGIEPATLGRTSKRPDPRTLPVVPVLLRRFLLGASAGRSFHGSCPFLGGASRCRCLQTLAGRARTCSAAAGGPRGPACLQGTPCDPGQPSGSAHGTARDRRSLGRPR